MIEVFKILHNIYDDEITEGLLQLSNVNTTRGHSLKLVAQQSWLEVRRNSFAVRVVKPLNALPEDVVMALSVKMFECQDLTNSGTISLLNSTTRKSCVSKLTI